MVGFTDPSHFVATFRRLEGLTPEQFKNMYL
jgi:AraC-like DNA-binding protein